MAIFPFQIMGGLAGARFMREVYWPLGMTQFHSTLTANQVNYLLMSLCQYYSALHLCPFKFKYN